MNNTQNRFSPEIRDRAVRMVGEHRAHSSSEWETITSIASKIGGTAETLRRWCREEAGRRAGPTAQATDERERLRLLEREVKELHRANEILRKSSAYLPPFSVCKQTPAGQRDGARPPREMVMGFINAPRKELGIEPICRELAIAP